MTGNGNTFWWFHVSTAACFASALGWTSPENFKSNPSTSSNCNAINASVARMATELNNSISRTHVFITTTWSSWAKLSKESPRSFNSQVHTQSTIWDATCYTAEILNYGENKEMWTITKFSFICLPFARNYKAQHPGRFSIKRLLSVWLSVPCWSSYRYLVNLFHMLTNSQIFTRAKQFSY